MRTLAFERFAIPPSRCSRRYALVHYTVCSTGPLFIFLPTNLNDLSGDENQQLAGQAADGEADAAAARAGLLADAPPNIAGQ